MGFKEFISGSGDAAELSRRRMRKKAIRDFEEKSETVRKFRKARKKSITTKTKRIGRELHQSRSLKPNPRKALRGFGLKSPLKRKAPQRFVVRKKKIKRRSRK